MIESRQAIALTIIDSNANMRRQMDERTTAPACRLDEDGLQAQLERYREISRHVETLEREPGRLVARLDPGLPQDRLERALEIERACCPFIVATHDSGERQLTLTVEETSQDPALDALFEALSPHQAGVNRPDG